MMMRVMYVQYTNPAGYPPLQHSSRLLANHGWDVLFLGTGAQGAHRLEFPQHPNIRVERLGYCAAGWRQKLHYAQFTLWVIAWLLRWRPRWIYASDPLSCPVAALLSFIPGLRVIYHEHDSPNTNPESAPSRFAQFILKVRGKVARRADLCVIPNEKRAERFRRYTATDRPVLNVWNCPALEEMNYAARREHRENFVVFFHGSIVPARLPISVLQALAGLPDRVVLRVAGYETAGHAGYVQKLVGEARRLRLGDRFKVLGSFPRYELLDHCRDASVGVSLMPLESSDVNEQAMTGASNKPFDYLACGLALLVSDLPDWKELFVDSGYGLSCNPQDPESIRRTLHWFFQHPEETRAMGARGRQRILTEWNYDRQFLPVMQHLGAIEVTA